MAFSIGLDMGGTKTAGAVFDDTGAIVLQNKLPTPAHDYAALLEACKKIVSELDAGSDGKGSIGIGCAGMIDREQGRVLAPNIPCMEGKPFRADCEKMFGRKVNLANDADCAALAEAIDGAGKDYHTVFGLIMGTGVGGGLIINKKILEGPNGLSGEIGHVPLPMREETDGPMVACGCGQKGCIDKSISGPALARLYKHMTGRDIEDANHVVTSLAAGDEDAKRVLDQFFTTVAKALVTVIHTLDPEIIIVGGGLNKLPGLYEEVPKRWGRFSLAKNPKTKLVQSYHGPLSGLRGAAMVGHR